jgi:hypothetical protein
MWHGRRCELDDAKREPEIGPRGNNHAERRPLPAAAHVDIFAKANFDLPPTLN